MELDSVYREFLVSQSHHFKWLVGILNPCRNLQAVRNCFPGDDQAVVASGLERVWQTLKDTGIIVRDQRRFAVHQALCTNDFGTENFCHALMTKTHSQDRQLWAEVRNDVAGKARFSRTAWAGADDNSFRSQLLNLLDGCLVISLYADLRVRADLSDPLNQVESERIIVIEQEDHPKPLNGIFQRPPNAAVFA